MTRPVRRDVLARLAALPGRVAGRVHHRHDAALSGCARTRREQRHPVDAAELALMRKTRQPSSTFSGLLDVHVATMHGSCDALIVGGGPAGSSCAWRLRQAGLDVLVVDAAVFPRDKVCAGWITPPVSRACSIWIRRTTGAGPDVPAHHGVPCRAHRRPPGRPDEYGHPVSYGIRRCEFDHYLLRRSGARLELGDAGDEHPPSPAGSGSSTTPSALACWSGPAASSVRWRER